MVSSPVQRVGYKLALLKQSITQEWFREFEREAAKNADLPHCSNRTALPSSEWKRRAVDDLSGTDFEPGVAQNWAQFFVSEKSE
jgi:hypothetical protein